MIFKYDRLNILQMPLYSVNELNELHKKFPEDIPCILINFCIDIVEMNAEMPDDSIVINLPDKELTEEQVSCFISVFKTEYEKTKEKHTFFRIYIADCKNTEILLGKVVVINKPSHVIVPIKNKNPVWFNHEKMTINEDEEKEEVTSESTLYPRQTSGLIFEFSNIGKDKNA